MFKTYQTYYGFITIDADTEQSPSDYSAVFDVTEDDAQIIKNGADISVDDTGLVITPQPLEGDIV